MQKKILTSIGIVIIIVAGLLLLREKFGINLNPLTLINLDQNTKKIESNIIIDNLSGNKVIPQTYAQNEIIDLVASFKNDGDQSASDTFTFKAYLVTGVWDMLKRDIKYQERQNGALIAEGKELISESDLLEMVKEFKCTRVNGNCYDNINTNDLNNKFGGVEVSFEEPKYEIKFDSTVAAKSSFTQNISFTPEDCGYYMLVIGNKKYWSLATGGGESKVKFIAVDKCNKIGQIASGVSDVRDKETPKIVTTAPVAELPVAGASGWVFALVLLIIGSIAKNKIRKVI